MLKEGSRRCHVNTTSLCAEDNFILEVVSNYDNGGDSLTAGVELSLKIWLESTKQEDRSTSLAQALAIDLASVCLISTKVSHSLEAKRVQPSKSVNGWKTRSKIQLKVGSGSKKRGPHA